jgi:D-3-phosphoglycerate dehydrogenase
VLYGAPPEVPVTDPVDALILDLLAFVAREERPYIEVMDAWRTSCPRLPVWEEANDRGLITRARSEGGAVVRITAQGEALLATARTAQ